MRVRRFSHDAMSSFVAMNSKQTPAHKPASTNLILLSSDTLKYQIVIGDKTLAPRALCVRRYACAVMCSLCLNRHSDSERHRTSTESGFKVFDAFSNIYKTFIFSHLNSKWLTAGDNAIGQLRGFITNHLILLYFE